MAPQAEPVRILLVGRPVSLRRSYLTLLEHKATFAVAGEAGDAEEAYRLFPLSSPNVVIMDFILPGSNAISAARVLLEQYPDARIVIIAMDEHMIFAAHAFASGAHGFVRKASTFESLAKAVHAAADGRQYLSPDIAWQFSLDETASPSRIASAQLLRPAINC